MLKILAGALMGGIIAVVILGLLWLLWITWVNRGKI
jgi:hypothetical protein